MLFCVFRHFSYVCHWVSYSMKRLCGDTWFSLDGDAGLTFTIRTCNVLLHLSHGNYNVVQPELNQG